MIMMMMKVDDDDDDDEYLVLGYITYVLESG